MYLFVSRKGILLPPTEACSFCALVCLSGLPAHALSCCVSARTPLGRLTRARPGSILNIAIMFYLSWLYGVIGVVMLLGLWMYLSMKGPEVDWGDVSQALMLSQARRFLLRIDQTHTHPKFWRPNLMLLSDGVLPGVVGFCNNLKKGGLFLVRTHRDDLGFNLTPSPPARHNLFWHRPHAPIPGRASISPVVEPATTGRAAAQLCVARSKLTAASAGGSCRRG